MVREIEVNGRRMEVYNYRTEMARHFREHLAKVGINARVRGTGPFSIKVFVPAFEFTWTHEEQKYIKQFAKNNGMTGVRGTEINVDFYSQALGLQFEFWLGDEATERWRANVARQPNIHARRTG